jgi:ABC-type transporter Mla subunit MlaD
VSSADDIRLLGDGPDRGLRRRTAAWLVLALLAVPSTAASSGPSANLLDLQRQIAGQTSELGGLIDGTTTTMTRMDRDLTAIRQTDDDMRRLVRTTASLRATTDALARRLAVTRRRVAQQGRALAAVSRQVEAVGGRMGTLSNELRGSLDSTSQVAASFGRVQHDMGGMDRDFAGLLRQMGATVPKVSYFATNRVRAKSPGGDSARYSALNVAAGSRVMSVMLPMIATLQSGGLLITNKIGHTATSPAVDQILQRQSPDGTNVKATVQPYDGRHGLPSRAWFQTHRVGGF